MATEIGTAIDGTLERAVFEISPGREEEFETALRDAVTVIAGADGFVSMSVLRSVEKKSTYMALIVWVSLAAHEAFRASSRFPVWRGLIEEYFDESPHVIHFHEVLALQR